MSLRSRIFNWTLLLSAGLAGLADAPRWFILLTAAGLTIDDWARLWPLRPPTVTLSPKAIAYFVAGVAANLFYAGAIFLAGAVVRALVR